MVYEFINLKVPISGALHSGSVRARLGHNNKFAHGTGGAISPSEVSCEECGYSGQR